MRQSIAIQVTSRKLWCALIFAFSIQTAFAANPPEGMLAETIRDCVDLGCGCNQPAPGQCGCGQYEDECGVCNGPGKTGCDHQCHSTKTVDECGVCGGPGRTGCDNQCGSTKVADACGVCEGDGLSCISTCAEPVYEVRVTTYSSHATYYPSGQRLPVHSGDRPSCLEEIWNSCGVTDNLVAQVGTNWMGPRPSEEHLRRSRADDCMVSHFLYADEHRLAASAGARFRRTNVVDLAPRYVNRNCQLINYPGYVCGDFHVRAAVRTSSPISLMWRKGASHKSEIGLSQFPLDPERPGTWYLWHASENTPLLVYDPEHKNTITSAEQLFGNFTFGKKWENGYKALQFLDVDQDGTLKGQEIEPLALWFDFNRDGVSQKGEVRTLREMLVKEVYTLPDESQQKFEVVPGALNDTVRKPKDVLATKGYLRVRDDLKEVLPSVDWYSVSASSKEELLLQLQRAESLGKEEKAIGPELQKLGKQIAHLGPFSGAWKWRMSQQEEVEGGPRPQGMLVFTENEGEITGHSLMEIPIKENPDKIHSAVLIFPLKGTSTVGIDGKSRIEFEVQGDKGAVTRSSAIIDSRGGALSGESSIATGENGTFAYRWIARRMVK